MARPEGGRPARGRGAAWLAALAVALATACGTPSPGGGGGRRPLRIALYAAPLSADPHLHGEFLTHTVASNVYEALTRLDAQLRVQPALAESWQSLDELTWRFRLRAGARFHDGRPLTARDVAFSLDRARDPDRSSYRGYLVSVREVRTVDERTVDVLTLRPNVVLLNKLSYVFVVPAGAPERIEQPIGTGPYRARFGPRRQQIDLTAFPDYWSAAPPEPRVELVAVSDDAERGRTLVAGEVDVAWSLPPEQAERVQLTPGCRVLAQPGLSMTYLYLNRQRPPFGDRRVREAVHLALDREALVARELRGFGRPAYQLVSRSVFGFAAGLGRGERDLVRARALLAQAGHSGGLDFELEHRPGWRVAELARQLAEAGLRAHARARPWHELVTRVNRGEVQASLSGLAFSSGDASEVLDTMLHTRDLQLGYGGDNPHYSNAELDRLIEASGQTADLRLRRVHLEQAMQLAMHDLPLVPLVVPDDLFGLRDDVTWNARADGRMLAVDVTRRR
jgi:peptide/nickel transport system substrate-binding protein